mmetsp:Transcript_6029/g.17618  ORF Transcript_6029/g.17618 Transcript_6029/m.17618 type:complete len:200 (-) Transcript_6029:35-634(-)
MKRFFCWIIRVPPIGPTHTIRSHSSTLISFHDRGFRMNIGTFFLGIPGLRTARYRRLRLAPNPNGLDPFQSLSERLGLLHPATHFVREQIRDYGTSVPLEAHLPDGHGRSAHQRVHGPLDHGDLAAPAGLPGQDDAQCPPLAALRLLPCEEVKHHVRVLGISLDLNRRTYIKNQGATRMQPPQQAACYACSRVLSYSMA